MSASKFSQPFMKKSPVTPLQNNAFLKAVKDARDNNKTSFTFNGKNYPLKMNTPLDLTAKQAKNLPPELVAEIKKKEGSPVNNNHNEDPKKIIGEQTFKFEKDKPSGNYVAGLSFDISKSAEPELTADRLVITPKQKKKMGVENFIDQYEKMNVKKDSASGGINFYSIAKTNK